MDNLIAFFHRVGWHEGGQRGGGHWLVSVLPEGLDTSVGSFGHLSNMEIGKQEDTNGKNTSNNGNFSLFLTVSGGV